MSEARLHVAFGTGQVGNALAAHLAGRASDFSGLGGTQGSVPPRPLGEGPRDV
jgi:hypothetical protein